MKNLSTEFKRALATNKRNYIANATITWPRDTQGNRQTLSLTNAEIWGGGFSYEELVSEDDEFTALGSVYMGTASLIINNMDERYNSYIFEDAETVILTIGLELPDSTSQSGKRTETHKIGTYHVSDATYDGTRVSLKLQDNIAKLDKPYVTSTLVYPATLAQIVSDVCTNCNLTLANNSLQFPQRNFSIAKRPDDDAITFRDILGWSATIAGCFVKCNADGQLEFKWFNQNVIEQELTLIDGGTITPWTEGEQYNGGTVSPWSTGTIIDAGIGERQYSFHRLTSLFSQNIALDDVVITGISIQVDNDDLEESSSSEDSGEFEPGEGDAEPEIDGEIEVSNIYYRGTDGYLISVTDNKFITYENVETIIDYLANQLIGLQFRKMTISIPNDPSIEAGDIMLVFDRKGREYIGLVTRTSFSIGGTQEIVSGASTPTRNSATIYSEYTRSVVAARRLLAKQKSAFDLAMDDLRTRLNSKAGLYPTIERTQSGNIYYLHDQPLLEDSTTVMKITNEAIGITNAYDGDDTDWNFGVTVDGTTITRILNAVGINASWIRTGVLSVHNSNDQEIFRFDADNGTLKIYDNSGNVIFDVNASTRAITLKPTTFTLTSANETTIKSWAQDKADSAESNAKTYADGKATTAESNAKTYADGKASTAESNAKNYVDGKGYQTASNVNALIGTYLTNNYDPIDHLTKSEIWDKLFKKANGTYAQGLEMDSNGDFFISAAYIKSGYLDANRIQAGSIVADKLNVNNLAAISANIGNLKLNNGRIESVTNYGTAYMQAGSSHTDIAFCVWSSGDSQTGTKTDKFKVTYGGKLYASDAEILGLLHSGSKVNYNSNVEGYCFEPNGNAGFRCSNGSYLKFDPSGIEASNIRFTAYGGSGFQAQIDASGNADLASVWTNLIKCGDSINTPSFMADQSYAYLPKIGATNTLMTLSNGRIYGTSSSKRYKIISEDKIVDTKVWYKLTAKIARYKQGHLPEGHEWEGHDMPMLIAEDVDAVCHEAAIHNEKGQVEDWNHRVIIPVHQQMLVEQHRIIEEQEKKIKSLEERLAKLEKLVEGMLA